MLFLSMIQARAYNQDVRQDTIRPVFRDTGMEVENRISLNISELKYRALHLIPGEKINLKAKEIIINDETIKVKTIKTRGKSTLMFRRKSLSVKLKSKATFRHIGREKSLMNFIMLNLSLDRYYCKNHLAFEMMDMLEIFHLFYSYGETDINGRCEGVFMILERPEDWALKEVNSPLVIRRGYDHKIDEYKTGSKTKKSEIKEYLGYYKEIYRALNHYEGEELYTALSEYLDIDNYMKWLAFNFLVRNGDYADEVFFYFNPKIKKYMIIPWDYDDIFATTPHEGNIQRDKILGDRLMFSSEDLLDIKIAADPYLYKIYLERLTEVLETLSPVALRQVIQETYAELYPYYSSKEIISNVQFDHFNDASMETLKTYLDQIYNLLYASRKNCLEIINSSVDQSRAAE
jgi:spore coat protein H